MSRSILHSCGKVRCYLCKPWKMRGISKIDHMKISDQKRSIITPEDD